VAARCADPEIPGDPGARRHDTGSFADPLGGDGTSPIWEARAERQADAHRDELTQFRAVPSTTGITASGTLPRARQATRP
jgi:hypothetical protein